MKYRSKLIHKQQISDDTFILRFEKGDFKFIAGQYIVISFLNEKEAREYSVYSGENDHFIEILIKTLPEGTFSVRLGDLLPGDMVMIDGPFGFFVMKQIEIASEKHIFIATGTGISPFKSYLKSYPNLNYHLYHGIRYIADKIESEFYKNITYCVTRDNSEHFKGRVTDALQHDGIAQDAIYHLCGNSAMINSVSDLLEQHNIPAVNIRTEAFF